MVRGQSSVCTSDLPQLQGITGQVIRVPNLNDLSSLMYKREKWMHIISFSEIVNISPSCLFSKWSLKSNPEINMASTLEEFAYLRYYKKSSKDCSVQVQLPVATSSIFKIRHWHLMDFYIFSTCALLKNNMWSDKDLY